MKYFGEYLSKAQSLNENCDSGAMAIEVSTVETDEGFRNTNLVPALHQTLFRFTQSLHESLFSELSVHFDNNRYDEDSEALRDKLKKMFGFTGLVDEHVIDSLINDVCLMAEQYYRPNKSSE